jgi:beta-ureidopropionase
MSAEPFKVAVTETRNAYVSMPDGLSDLPRLASELEAIRKANVDHHRELIAAAAGAGVALIGLGELFTGPYFALENRPMWRGLAESAIDGPTITTMCELARQHGLGIVAPIYEHDQQTDRYFNTAVVIDPDGNTVGTYRKNHIPAGRNAMGEFFETAYYQASDGGSAHATGPRVSGTGHYPVFDMGCCKLGVAICYDRHFSGTMRELARGGAELVLCPSVTFGLKSREAWDAEFVCDSIRHNLFIGGSNRRGSEKPWDVSFFGEGYFSGPNGRLPNLSEDDRLIIAEIDPQLRNDDDPSGWNFARDRRPEIGD